SHLLSLRLAQHKNSAAEQTESTASKRRRVRAYCSTRLFLCLLEELQRMDKTPRLVAKIHRPSLQKKPDPITRSKAIATRPKRRFCYISVASRLRRERSRRIENTIRVTTARNITTIKTLIAVSRKPPSVTIEPSNVITSRISAAIPPSALRMNAIG